MNNKTNHFPKMERNIAERFNLLPNHLLANLDGATDRVTSQSSERIGFYCDHEEADIKMVASIKYIFQKWRETLPNVLTSSQTIYLANLDGATDRVTSQSSERIAFYCDHEEADMKMVAHIKFLCDNICLNKVIIVLPDSDAAVISLYQSVTNLTFLDALWFKIGIGDDQRYIPTHVLASELGLPICCWLSAMHAVCDSVNSFSHIRKITTFQTLKNKIDELTNMIDFRDFLHSF